LGKFYLQQFLPWAIFTLGIFHLGLFYLEKFLPWAIFTLGNFYLGQFLPFAIL
jgi:hypothetical protein